MSELIASYHDSAKFHRRLARTEPGNRSKWLSRANWETSIARALANA